MNKTWMGSTAVATGLLLAATAANAAPANSNASDEPSIGQNTANVGEVVVTAQRRVQKLSEVPETVIALSASQLTRAGVSGPPGERDKLQFAVHVPDGLENNRSAC